MMLADNGSKIAQKGSVLVIALLLLLVLTILGVASMSGTLMQERMAGNVNLQTLAFNAASAGVASSIDFANPSAWGNDSGGNPRTCVRGAASEWKAAWTNFQVFEAANAPEGTTVAYRQRVGCFEAENALAHWDDPDDIPLQLLVLNQGVVCSGTNSASCLSGSDLSANVLAVREVEVRVETRGGNPDCLIELGAINPANLPCTGQGGGNCPIQMPSSGQGGEGSRIDARPGGCPTAPADQTTATEMLRQLRHGNDRTGWYQPQPAVRVRQPDPFWTDANAFATAANAIKIGVRGYQAGFTNSDGDNLFQACQGRVLTGNPVTQCPNDGVTYPITYVAGDLNLNASGNNSCRVQGSILVENELRFNGQVSYEADFILMGGRLDINGMGGNVSQGLIKLYNLLSPNPTRSRAVAYDLDSVSMGLNELYNISGMGNSQIRSEDCGTVVARWENLNTCLEAVFDLENTTFLVDPNDPDSGEINWFQGPDNAGSERLDEPLFGGTLVRFPVPNCFDIVSGAGRRDVIASWREYLDRERW